MLDMAGEKKKREKRRITEGVVGGSGGAAWNDGSYNGVREIAVVYGCCIDSIRVVYDKNGKPFAGEKHGGVGGNRTAEMKLQFPEESLTSVSGYISAVAHGTTPVIRSLTFKTDKRIYGPYGIEEGTPFSLPIEGGRILGFKGRSGRYLDALGFHLSPHVQIPNFFQHSFNKLTSSVH